MKKLFIPKKLRVGFVERKDTFAGKLAFVIYYDDKGKIRQEKSFDGWRDKKIDAEEFENDPVSGLVLNKSIQRCSWSHFSSNRSMVRIYDGRGFEYEITPQNLLYILMHTNCVKRELEGEFVYGWSGGKLTLLSTACEEYQESLDHTSLQQTRVYVKDLVQGATYQHKDGSSWVYLDKLDFYDVVDYGRCSHKQREKRGGYYTWNNFKGFVFYNAFGDKFESFSSVGVFSKCLDETCSTDYANIFEKFQKSENASAIKEVKNASVPFKLKTISISSYGHYDLKDAAVEIISNNDHITCYLYIERKGRKLKIRAINKYVSSTEERNRELIKLGQYSHGYDFCQLQHGYENLLSNKEQLKKLLHPDHVFRTWERKSVIDYRDRVVRGEEKFQLIEEFPETLNRMHFEMENGYKKQIKIKADY